VKERFMKTEGGGTSEQDKGGKWNMDEKNDKVDRGGGQKQTEEESVLSPSPKSTTKTIQGMRIAN